MEREVINLMKSYINTHSIDKNELDRLQIKLSTAIDSSIVNNEPTDEMQSLYDDILWLKCDILKY